MLLGRCDESAERLFCGGCSNSNHSLFFSVIKGLSSPASSVVLRAGTLLCNTCLSEPVKDNLLVTYAVAQLAHVQGLL